MLRHPFVQPRRESRPTRQRRLAQQSLARCRLDQRGGKPREVAVKGETSGSRTRIRRHTLGSPRARTEFQDSRPDEASCRCRRSSKISGRRDEHRATARKSSVAQQQGRCSRDARPPTRQKPMGQNRIRRFTPDHAAATWSSIERHFHAVQGIVNRQHPTSAGAGADCGGQQREPAEPCTKPPPWRKTIGACQRNRPAMPARPPARRCRRACAS